jgi:Uncharacterized protein conserved in bacteria
MPVIVKTTLLLIGSNLFMTFAWYAHLKNLHNKPLYIAILVSWGIALFEYMLQVPANRIGSTQLELGQLKILQEVITLSVFVPVRRSVHARAGEAELPVGSAVHGGGGVFHVSAVAFWPLCSSYRTSISSLSSPIHRVT